MEARIYNFKTWINLTYEKELKEYIYNCLKNSNFKILNFCDYYFQPLGYTALWLLGESHCAIHTFPEKNRTYLELSSCSKSKYNVFTSIINNSNYICKGER